MEEWLSKPLHLSINKRLVNKNISGKKGNFTHFYPVTLTPYELSESIKAGFAYSYVFNGERSKKNFVRADLVSVDVDGGTTLDEVFEHDLVRKYATIVYTTPSHTPKCHRFRVVFALEQPIHDLEKLEALASALAGHLSGDRAPTTSASLFYGNTNADIQLFDRGLYADVAERLISEGPSDESVRLSATKLPSERRQLSDTFDLDLVIDMADGRKLVAREIKSSISIRCPFHDDTNPSAIFNINADGERNIYCFVCNKLYVEQDPLQGYDFNGFESAVLALKEGEQTEFPGWVPEPAKSAFLRARPAVTDTRYFQGIKLANGLTFIKSPKSTGKTKALEDLVAAAPKARVLLIGHRRSLIRAMCRRLHLDCYLDRKLKGGGSSQSRLGICLDSLLTIDTTKSYDYIMIDECEQVLAHFFSDTMADKRSAILRRLINIIGNASNLVALDADLSWVSYGFLTDWFNRRSVRSPPNICLNRYVAAAQPVELFQSCNHLIGDLVTNLRNGKRCYVVSNNKGFVDSLSAAVALNDPEVKFVSITADTARIKGDNAAAFVVDPVAQSRRYQLILSSPALSSGVDIRFQDNERYFDVVYGFFPSTTTTHFDCDQQIARVRDPGSIKLFLTPATQSFEIDVDVISTELRRSTIFSYLLPDDDSEGEIQPKSDDLFQLALPVHALQWASKNRFRDNFLDYKRRSGWQFNYISPDVDLLELGRCYLSEGKSESSDRYVERLMNSASLTDYEVELLINKRKAGEKLTLQEADSIRRTFIERFYRREIFEGLVKLDKKVRLREKVLTFERIVDPTFNSTDRLVIEAQFLSNGADALITPDENLKLFLLREALSLTPVFDGENFLPSNWFQRNDLSRFRDHIIGNMALYEAQFGRKFDTIIDNETKVLSDLLKYVYLPLRKKRRTGPDGARIAYYKLNEVKLEGLTKLVRIRKRKVREYGNEIDGFR
jgi:hypothetical protein